MTDDTKPAVIQAARPWISINLPDTRGWIVLGLFTLSGGILTGIYVRPEIASNQPFMLLAQAVIISGLITVVNFFFGASKGASEANARADKALDKIPDQSGAGQ
jgi:hypothetical protein